MSEMPQSAEEIPPLTLGWRLQMALHKSGLTRTEIANGLGVDVSTASRWMNDRGAPPKKAYITQWAWLTRVPVGWLEKGANTPFGDPIRHEGGAMTTSQYLDEMLPFTGFADPVTNPGSHGNPWQLPATARVAVDMTDLHLAGTESNDQRCHQVRGEHEPVSATEETDSDHRVAA